MTSQAQLTANQINAELSTGPRTEEGKQRSRLNAFRHGLTGQVCIFTQEDQDAFDAHCEGIRESLAPQGALELELAQSIAEDRWRLKRARALEHAIFALGHEGEPGEIVAEHPELHAALAQGRTWLADGRNLQLLTLYEQRIHRSIEKNMAQLRALQAERRAAQKQALEEAELLAKLAYMKGDSYDPAPDFPMPEPENGFVFSTSQINRIIERNQRLKDARFYAARSWNPDFSPSDTGVPIP
jgi:hypothetical protein